MSLPFSSCRSQAKESDAEEGRKGERKAKAEEVYAGPTPRGHREIETGMRAPSERGTVGCPHRGPRARSRIARARRAVRCARRYSIPLLHHPSTDTTGCPVVPARHCSVPQCSVSRLTRSAPRRVPVQAAPNRARAVRRCEPVQERPAPTPTPSFACLASSS